RRVRRHAAQDSGAGRGGDSRGVRQAGARGARRRGARRGETADAGAADVVAGESYCPDVSFGELSDIWRAVSQSGRSGGGGGGTHGERGRRCGGGVLRPRQTDGGLARQRLRDVTENRHGTTSRKDVRPEFP